MDTLIFRYISCILLTVGIIGIFALLYGSVKIGLWYSNQKRIHHQCPGYLDPNDSRKCGESTIWYLFRRIFVMDDDKFMKRFSKMREQIHQNDVKDWTDLFNYMPTILYKHYSPESDDGFFLSGTYPRDLWNGLLEHLRNLSIRMILTEDGIFIPGTVWIMFNHPQYKNARAA